MVCVRGIGASGQAMGSDALIGKMESKPVTPDDGGRRNHRQHHLQRRKVLLRKMKKRMAMRCHYEDNPSPQGNKRKVQRDAQNKAGDSANWSVLHRTEMDGTWSSPKKGWQQDSYAFKASKGFEHLPQASNSDITLLTMPAIGRRYRADVGITRRKSYADCITGPDRCKDSAILSTHSAILGLAPERRGHRTGRVFTGDRSEIFGLRAMHRWAFANQRPASPIDDG